MLKVKNLHAEINGKEILKGINLEVRPGEVHAIMGPNGSGKSTLLLQINGLLLPSRGEVTVGDIPVTKKTLRLVRQSVGLVFQNSDDMLFMPTIGEDVAFGPRNMGLPDAEVERRVGAALESVGLAGFEDRPAFSLSGGQRRAAAIASVLSMEPDILVLDEPSANLDARARRQLIDILAGFSHTVLLATHDTGMALELCPRALVMDAGRIVADAPTALLAASTDSVAAGIFDTARTAPIPVPAAN